MLFFVANLCIAGPGGKGGEGMKQFSANLKVRRNFCFYFLFFCFLCWWRLVIGGICG